MAKTPNTEVRISFFKPQGIEDTHVVALEDRGAAAAQVLAYYGPKTRSCLNSIWTRHCGDAPTPVPTEVREAWG